MEEEDEPKVKEITDDSEIDGVLIDCWTIGTSVNPRKAAHRLEDMHKIIRNLLNSGDYLEFCDFDDHLQFGEDFTNESRDWSK